MGGCERLLRDGLREVMGQIMRSLLGCCKMSVMLQMGKQPRGSHATCHRHWFSRGSRLGAEL